MALKPDHQSRQVSRVPDHPCTKWVILIHICSCTKWCLHLHHFDIKQIWANYHKKTLLWQCGAGGWFHSHSSIKQMQFDSGHCFAWLIGHEFFKDPKWCATPSAALGQPRGPRSRNNATTKPRRRGEEMPWSWLCWNRTIGSTIPNLFILWMVYIPKYEWFSIALPTLLDYFVRLFYFWEDFEGLGFDLNCFADHVFCWRGLANTFQHAESQAKPIGYSNKWFR